MAQSAGIILPGQTVANTTKPAVGSVNIFANSAAALDAPYWLDSNGAAHPLGQGDVDWVNVTLQLANPVLPGQAAATNSTNIALILAAAASNSVIYFPAGTYQFASAIVVGAKAFLFQGDGQYSSILQTTSATADLFTLTDGNWYTTFSDLQMTTSITKTAGNMVTTGTVSGGGNVGINVRRCTIAGSSGINIWNGLYYAGTQSGNITAIEDCTFNNFANYAIQIIGNTSTPASSCNGTITNIVINGILSAGNGLGGIVVNQCGSLIISNSDVIGCVNNLLLSPTTTATSSGVFSVFAVNCYFDDSAGSGLLMSGAGNIERCVFTNCWFTTAASPASSSAVQSTNTAAIGCTGIQFLGCQVYNTYGTATAFGFNMTGCEDVTITGCNVAGWTTAVAITPYSAAGYTSINLTNNVIGPVGNIAANTTAIVINAGSFTYKTLNIQGNNLAGNTTAITDSSTGFTVNKYFVNNTGYNPHSAVTTPVVPGSATAVTNTTGVPVTVYVKGGTLTVIAVGGVTTGIAAAAAASTAFPIPLAPGQTIAITYSVAPTWVWVGA